MLRVEETFLIMALALASCVGAAHDAQTDYTPNDGETSGLYREEASSTVSPQEAPATTVTAASSPATDPMMVRPRCVSKPTQVMLIGDSYINWITHSFPQDLATASGQRGWRLEAVGGAPLGSGGVAKPIPKQFDDSLARDPEVHTLVMDGSANDIIVASPKLDPTADCINSAEAASLPHCRQIVDLAVETGLKLFERAAVAGVRDVVYFNHPTIPRNTLFGGGKNPDAITAYKLPKVREMCSRASARTGGKLRCHFMDMAPVLAGHDDWYSLFDLHPNAKGGKAMAEALWATMKNVCVGQLASSGCCDP